MSGNRAQRRAGVPARSLDERYGRRRERRALAPAVVGAVVLLAGLVFIGQDGYLVARFLVAILALIVAVFAWQARRWAWVPVPIVVAVLWNPILPFAFSGQPFRLGHLVAALALLATGVFASARPGGPARAA